MVPCSSCHTKWASNVSEEQSKVIVLMMGSGTLGNLRLLELRVVFINICCSI